jgi:hypothetical protein
MSQLETTTINEVRLHQLKCLSEFIFSTPGLVYPFVSILLFRVLPNVLALWPEQEQKAINDPGQYILDETISDEEGMPKAQAIRNLATRLWLHLSQLN